MTRGNGRIRRTEEHAGAQRDHRGANGQVRECERERSRLAGQANGQTGAGWKRKSDGIERMRGGHGRVGGSGHAGNAKGSAAALLPARAQMRGRPYKPSRSNSSLRVLMDIFS